MPTRDPADERLQAVVDLLRQRSSASLPEIAGAFNVSEMTVRRDLQKLEESGAVIRTPGGARLARAVSYEKSFAERLRKMSAAKDRIGRACAAMVAESDAVVLGSGTTTLSIARHLRRHRNIVVFTCSLAVAEELAAADSLRLELTGGVYRHSSHDLIGPSVADSLSRLYAHTVFAGASAISFDRGVMVSDPDAHRSLLSSAARRVLVADSSKIGHEALYSYAQLSDFHTLVTDSGILPAHRDRLQKSIEVIVAE